MFVIVLCFYEIRGKYYCLFKQCFMKSLLNGIRWWRRNCTWSKNIFSLRRIVPEVKISSTQEFLSNVFGSMYCSKECGSNWNASYMPQPKQCWRGGLLGVTIRFGATFIPKERSQVCIDWSRLHGNQIISYIRDEAEVQKTSNTDSVDKCLRDVLMCRWLKS